LTIETARWVSFGALLVAAAGFWTAGKRAGASPTLAAIAVSIWLVAPRVVVVGNLTRQEAFVLAFVAWSLAATIQRRRVLALGLAGFAAMTHPAGLVLAFVLVAANARASADDEPPRVRDWAVVGLLATLFVFEVAHYAANLQVVHDHMSFQWRIKAERPPATVAAPLPALCLVVIGVALSRLGTLRRRAGHVLLALAGAGVVIHVIGNEIWYGMYGVETALLLGGLGLLSLGAASPKRFASRHAFTIAGAVAAAAVSLVFVGYSQGFNGMHLGDSPTEWPGFVAEVSATLSEIASASPTPATVLISDYSALPWPLETDHIGTMQIAKHTPLSGPADSADYLLWVRSACCPAALPPDGQVVARVVSSSSEFEAILFDTRVLLGSD
jgi:hypothetical protein